MVRGVTPTLSFIVLGILVLTTSVDQAKTQPLGRLDTVSTKPYEQTVRQLKWALGGYGMTIVGTLNYQQILKKMKVDIKQSVIFEVLRRPWAKTIFEHEPGAGLEIPIRIYVYERGDGRTVVSYYQPSAILGAYGNDGLKELGRELDGKLHAIVQSTTK